MSALTDQLRERARSESSASELWANGKSARNQAAGDEGASYQWSKPEETLPWKAAEEIERLEKTAAEIKALAAEQAEDEGLWFIAQTAPEAYLQAALRRLHEAVEGKTARQCAIDALEGLS